MGKLIKSVNIHGLEIPVLDLRDPKDSERLHFGEAERLLGIENLGAPTSVSGRDLRDDLEAHRFIASLVINAADYLRDWRAAAGAKNMRMRNKGLGGSIVHLPVAIVVSNYGAHVATDRNQERVNYL